MIIDSIAALARKEGFNERDKEEFFITQVTLFISEFAPLCGFSVIFSRLKLPSMHKLLTAFLPFYNKCLKYAGSTIAGWFTELIVIILISDTISRQHN